MTNCDVCGAEMTGFTVMFCPRCEENKTQPVADHRPEVKPFVTHRMYTPVMSHSLGGKPGVTSVPNHASSVPQVPTTWTQREAVHWCRQIEKKIAPLGWHVGLTGGTLYKPGVRKDVDFIIYPHVVNSMRVYGLDEIKTVVEKVAACLGYGTWSIRQSTHYKDGKLLFKVGDSIDIFVFGV